MSKVDFSLILACYNEGSTFEKSVDQIESVLEDLAIKWEIIFVEDKSIDNTKAKIESLLAKSKNSRAIYHKVNLGRGKSVSDGIAAANGQICGYMDVDCEISPKYIPVFIGEIENGFDMAVGERFYEKRLNSLVRFAASKIYSYIVALFLNLPIEDTEAGYKFFRRRAILPVSARVRDKRWFWDTEICARAYLAGLKISQVPVLFVRRSDKKSTVRLVPDSIEYIRRILEFKRGL